MSHQMIRSDSSKDGTPEDCLQSYQYVWMSHWTQTRSRSVDHVHNQLPTSCESGENSCRNKLVNSLAGPEIEPNAPKFMKEFRETNKVLVTESSTRTCNILRPVALKSQKHFPMFKSSQYTEGNLVLKIGTSSGHQQRMPSSKLGPVSVCDASYDPTDNSKPDIQLIESLPHPRGKSSIPGKQAKDDRFLDERRVGVASLARDELLGSTSANVMLEFNSTRTPVGSLSPKKDCINQTSTSFLVHEGKKGKGTHGIESSNSCDRDFLGQQLHTMTSYALPSIRPVNLHHGLSELPRNTSSVLGKGTVRICTTIEAGGPSKFSQTTRHIFIKEDTNVNLSKGVQILEESTSTNFKREPPSKVLSFSPGLGLNLKQGVKLQPLDSSTESEGKEKIEKVQCAVDLKNDSSAETETMDMDALQENCIIDVAQSVAKDINEDLKSPSSEGALNSVKDKSRGLMLPDINVELPPISSDASSADDENTSTSKTQSMGASDFLTRAEYPTNLKSNVSMARPLELDPCSRWVKRLKPSSSVGVAYGTKSSEMAEASSHEKVNKIFKRMLYFGKSNEEHAEMNQGADLQRNVESSSAGLVKAGQEELLSNAWIRRWCHNPASVASRDPLMSSKAMQNNIYKEQYPSLAAMALMGKAMGGFRSCELRRDGSCMIWNA